MTRARVVRVEFLEAHPNADRLDCLTVWDGAWERHHLVTGKHYRHGQMGIHIPVGALIPGWLAVDSWLWGATVDKPWTVLEKNMRGKVSDGLFIGEFYRVDPDDSRSIERYSHHAGLTGKDYNDEGHPTGWTKWAPWNDGWRLGFDVTDDLCIELS